MNSEEIKKIIENQWPDSKTQVADLTGTQDHYQVTIVSSAFEGKKMIEQHRLVKSLFDPHIQSGEVHALSLKTYSPAEWEKFNK
jgi:acid stress-induced BolA-like protein IbaG/YrbA